MYCYTPISHVSPRSCSQFSVFWWVWGRRPHFTASTGPSVHLLREMSLEVLLSPPGPLFLPFLIFFLLESSLKASAAFWSLVTKNSMSSRMWFRICCQIKSSQVWGYRDFYSEALNKQIIMCTDFPSELPNSSLLSCEPERLRPSSQISSVLTRLTTSRSTRAAVISSGPSSSANCLCFSSTGRKITK